MKANRKVPSILLLVGSSLLAGASAAADLPANYFANAPAEVREFVGKAKAADALSDPLARCLAYPDLPGNNWATGMAEAQCQFGLEKRLSLEDMREYVDKGRLSELDSVLRNALDRHFSDSDFSELIHLHLDAITADYDSGALTQDWLAAAPESPFANQARGRYFLAMAQKARGGKFVQDTPAENMVRMAEYVVLAVDFFNEALRLEPRYIDAYVGLISAARVDSRDELAEHAFNQAEQLDSGCRRVSSNRMASLLPRWGGSYEQMEAYARTLQPLLKRRPLLANTLAEIDSDKADALKRKGKLDEAIATLTPVARTVTYYDAHDTLASWLANAGKADESPWPQLLHLLTASRFTTLEPRAQRQLGQLLFQHELDLAWAESLLAAAVQADPESPYGRYWLARVYLVARRYAEAEPLFAGLVNEEGYEWRALETLIGISHELGNSKRAHEYLAQLRRRFPDASGVWFVEGVLLLNERKQQQAIVSLRQFMKASEGETGQLDNRRRIRYVLEQIDPVDETLP